MTAPRPLPAPSAADLAAMPRAAEQFQWNDRQKLVAHRNMQHLFPAHVVTAGASVRELPRQPDGALLEALAAAGIDVAGYMEAAESTALLVIRRGRIVLERYARGNDDSTRWASRSMAKSITSLMVGAAILDGAIRSVDDPVVGYLPELAGTHYDAVSIRHCLQMTSGLAYSEDYTDTSSDVAKLQLCTVNGKPGGFLALLKALGSRTDRKANVPGSTFNYCSADTVLLGLVLERATGRTAPVLLEQKLWSRLGVEGDAYWNLEAPGGSAFTASGFGATLRDYGRLGQFVLEGATLPGHPPLLPDGWLKESTTPSAASIAAGTPYGYQWWLHQHDGIVSTKLGTNDVRLPGGATVFYAIGNAGQAILVNPAEDTVIVKWAVWASASQFEERRRQDQKFFAALFEALQTL
ncbi:CubicO group peptidase, beta-lactamase class C family [Enhydrobacter aerosaccus]|uniref:CubicO group peptidase, beta-lactamase class C family n=1 Tax=Enhydrobacter aerosaccus TaxID=225324 RepID=A0A1T4JQS7_9HYPH|nr:serine hydrolase [Enhydrobacter aerosaccus]SJZ32479.1 CubicO group peptidase, beta-lactamase class C family [Enhydrobacter aerosaccus]